MEIMKLMFKIHKNMKNNRMMTINLTFPSLVMKWGNLEEKIK